MRAQSVLKSKVSGGGSTGNNKDWEETRKQLQEMKDKHYNLRVYCTDLETKQQQIVSSWSDVVKHSIGVRLYSLHLGERGHCNY